MAQHLVTDMLDTNLIVHYIVGDIPEQRVAVSRLLNEPGTIHAISDLAITEAVYVLEDHYDYSRVDIVSMIQKFLEEYDDVLDYNSSLFWLVFPYYVKRPALSFNDCCMAFYAEINGNEPLWTFDRNLARQHPSAKRLE